MILMEISMATTMLMTSNHEMIMKIMFMLKFTWTASMPE